MENRNACTQNLLAEPFLLDRDLQWFSMPGRFSSGLYPATKGNFAMARPDNQFSGPELCALSARKMVELLRRREVSVGEMLKAAYARIDAVEPDVNALPILCRERATSAAASLSGNSDHPAWLAGLAITIKDSMPVNGVLATSGSFGLKEFVPDTSDPLVERLENRGAVVIAKSNMPEFGAGGNTFNKVFGATRNPWDTRKNAGGSSGGAAVSLATGETWLAQGSDLAGSLRTPAAYCGVVGLRPSPGRAGGGSPAAAFNIDSVAGPMARDVSDLALFLDAMAGFDERQPISLEEPALSFQSAVERADANIRVAFSEDQGGFAPVEPEIRQIMRDAMMKVENAGGTVSVACPDLPDQYETSVVLRGINYAVLEANIPKHIQKHFKETLRQNIDFGLKLTPAQIFAAQRGRSLLYHRMREFLQDHDVFAIPVVGLEPGLVEEEFPTSIDGQSITSYIDWLKFSFLATTCALPALSLPIGFTKSGMPVGIQLIGPARGEAKLLRVARAIEEAMQFGASPINPVRRH